MLKTLDSARILFSGFISGQKNVCVFAASWVIALLAWWSKNKNKVYQISYVISFVVHVFAQQWQHYKQLFNSLSVTFVAWKLQTVPENWLCLRSLIVLFHTALLFLAVSQTAQQTEFKPSCTLSRLSAFPRLAAVLYIINVSLSILLIVLHLCTGGCAQVSLHIVLCICGFLF